jgi:CubicO group peptidase (beta-lactamase class C family)
MLRRSLLTALPATLWLGAGRAQAATLVEGFAPERLARIRPLLARGVADKVMAGAVWRVMRHGRIVGEGTVGLADIESGRPMTADAIFRIFSMTKPITTVTALTLYEEGVFDLHDPVSKWIPEFGDVMVQHVTPDGLGGRTVHLAPPTRPIMVLDLMRHTCGYGYGSPFDGAGEILYAKQGVTRTDIPLAEWVARLAKVPLVCDPGTRFNYGYGLDILGRLVEIWSGKSLDVAMHERVFAPLGMGDTGFWVSPAKASRVTTMYSPSRMGAVLPDGSRDFGGPVVRTPGRIQDGWKSDPVLKFGGAGLLSTLEDYTRFVNMLAGGGALGSQRVLAPATVAMMGSDVLGSIPASPAEIWSGYGFGLSVEVDRGPGGAATPVSAGSFDWGGAGSTWMWVDPKTGVTGLLMLQVFPSSPRWAQLFKQVVYGALVDPG